MADFDHSGITPASGPGGTLGNHVIQGIGDFANTAAREAYTVLSTDVGRVTRQSDTNQWHIAIATGTGSAAWQLIGSAVSALTTKGDLATYDTGDARLAVGANAFSPVGDSTEATGLTYIPTNTSSGILTGCVVTINGGDAATFDVSSGTVMTWDWSSGLPAAKHVIFGGLTGEAVTNIGSTAFTSLFINSSGTVVQFQDANSTAE